MNTAFANLIGFDGVQSGNGEVEIDFVGPAVPEPSTWAMLLLGFAGLGALAYRRNRNGRRPAKA
ncbi:MAG TPA: PEPxxWA-CTERM sorting domain-containing protein [Roseiarcus sp.]